MSPLSGQDILVKFMIMRGGLVMFEDDPRADDFDRYGVVYRPETTIFSRASLSELFKSPDRQEYESFVRVMEQTKRRREKAYG
jgi:hypothetical protein